MQVVLLCLFVIVCESSIIRHISASIAYQTKANYQINVPIMFHYDIKLTKKLAKEYSFKTRKKIQSISKNILKEASSIFNHSSLNKTINFTLIGTKFIRDIRAVRLDENASNYLRSYCDWQTKKKIIKKKMYYSVLLSGLDLFYVNNGKPVRGSVGRSYRNGVCSISKSCTLIEWVPRNMAYLLAHEIAHSFGVYHDGPPFNKCNSQKYIMAPRYVPTKRASVWSHCSKISMEKFLRSRKAWCVHPGSDNYFDSIDFNPI
ncbi:A disintegrin and metalloproteinase with thrombospondin motifs 16-like [Leptidea sinapis]|uniref:A disintegrin and metalloproteinase with thrombospondin motifs 16-like n=1 Tax=Leptidea sinapis TaxID=189913 RepID=UPI002126151F|nr:A disintegrin and metalloproteinase with thrombospondin motifs 16-like [Leptidea sinapis]